MKNWQQIIALPVILETGSDMLQYSCDQSAKLNENGWKSTMGCTLIRRIYCESTHFHAVKFFVILLQIFVPIRQFLYLQFLDSSYGPTIQKEFWFHFCTCFLKQEKHESECRVKISLFTVSYAFYVSFDTNA